ncbi:MAG TPA: deaminase [Candidatus Saccharimonadales bacterium]|jgi:deoxycytidylate deaminase|nr:deaminase [Candidatus Saccharimonadales bacterium]
MTNYDWSDLAFGSKKEINGLDAIFVAAPREISVARLKQIVKEYLPKGNLLIGLAKEKYIDGFKGQAQFKTLQLGAIEKTADKINNAGFKNKIYTLSYFQRDLIFVLEKLRLKKDLFINGSWKYLFHNLPVYYTLVSKKIEYEMLSPFINDQEAKSYEKSVLQNEQKVTGLYTAKQMFLMADEIAKRSFDYVYQTGLTVGLKKGAKYKFVAQSFNKVVPYQTYAMHNGSAREANFSPVNDLNYYDTVHAEVGLLLRAQKQKINLKGTTLFINLLPCPNCALMLCDTDIKEFVYRTDHSEGTAAKLLEAAGKRITRVVQ